MRFWYFDDQHWLIDIFLAVGVYSLWRIKSGIFLIYHLLLSSLEERASWRREEVESSDRQHEVRLVWLKAIAEALYDNRGKPRIRSETE